MKLLKKIVFIFIVVLLVVPPFFATASINSSKSEADKITGDGTFSTKDETIYATLTAHGEGKNIYVVNSFDIVKPGKMIDYGTYSSVKNLTDLSAIEQVNHTIQFTAEEGRFYYQGNLNNIDLPWDISIFYYLDEKEISPEDLAGRDGKVKIRIKTAANEKVDPIFFENYVLQISLSLDSSFFTNIKAEDGMIANAGKNKQVTFTVMPENEAEFEVEADVEDFELEGINITGVPSTMSIDAPNTDELTEDMKTLKGAIGNINEGIGKLKNGIYELHTGVVALQGGSEQFQHGLSKLNENSSELANGSKQLNEALETISNSLGEIEEMNLSELVQLIDGLSQISTGLGEITTGLTTLKKNYAGAYNAMDASIQAIPSDGITDKEIEDLYKAGADSQIVDQLVKTYTAAQTAKATYANVKQAFDAVNGTLDSVIRSLNEIANHVDTMVTDLSSIEDITGPDGFVQLQEGMKLLSENYKLFHSGLIAYTEGVNKLSGSYQELHSGIDEVTEGTKKLGTGAEGLHNGTTKLQQSTADLPEQMTEEIDRMIAEYDRSDFDAVSFISPKNDKVDVVQFILKTESITSEESDTTEEQVEKEKGFWQRLKELFS